MNKPPQIKVDPNPVKEGGTVTVTGDPGGLIFVGYDGNTTVHELDDEAVLKLKVPGEGGECFTVTDGKWPNPSSVRVKIVSRDK